MVLGDEATFSMRIDPAPQVEAPLVFAGHGLAIPELNHDDFAGLDVKGKVVVHLSGSPRNVPGALSAHYQSAAERWGALKRLGAIGTITIPNPKSMDVPWERSAPNRLNPAMALADASTDDTAGAQVSIAFNPAQAEKLFEGSGHTLAEVLKIADEGKALPHFPLPTSMKATVGRGLAGGGVAERRRRGEGQRPGAGRRVRGALRAPGSRRRRRGDQRRQHLQRRDGQRLGHRHADRVGQGRGRGRPRRSVLFVAVTGEEKGLLGSRYFALHPTVPKANLVANINMDMFLPLFPMKSVMVLGLDESELGDDIRAVAQGLGSPCRPTRSRSATASSAATSTASSARGCRRWR